MKQIKGLTLILALLMLISPLLVLKSTTFAANPVYLSVEPIATPPLTNLNASINGLETPPTPSPVGQNFTVSVHLRGATAANVPAGMSGVEVHFYFGNILAYAVPTGYIDALGTTGGVLKGPQNKLLYGVSAGFYDAAGNQLNPPDTTGAVRYEAAAASTAGGWNGADGLVANITFQIIKQPQSSSSEQTVSFELANDFTDLSDANAAPVSHDNIPGTLTIDATPGTGQQRYSLTVNVVGNGTVTQNPASATYLDGTIVTLTAVPGFNWTFQGWSGDLTGAQNPASITMNGNKTVTATFVVAQYYSLTVNVVGNGTVTQNPASATYVSGTNVTLTANPDVNFTFSGWSGDLTGLQNPASLIMDANKTVNATFAKGMPGDLNHDGHIDLHDLAVFAQAWHSRPGDPNWNPECDIAKQGVINLVDFVTFAIFYGKELQP
jgi:hypothetical protein